MTLDNTNTIVDGNSATFGTNKNRILSLALASNKWQFIILNKNGSTAHKLIQIFSRIVYHFRKHKQTSQDSNNIATDSIDALDTLFQTSLQSLAQQYNCSKSTINRSIARLEKMGYIKRHHKHIKSKKGQWLYNVLFLELTLQGHELLNMVPTRKGKCSSCTKIAPLSKQIGEDILLEKDKIKDIDLKKSIILEKCENVLEEKNQQLRIVETVRAVKEQKYNNHSQIVETTVEKAIEVITRDNHTITATVVCSQTQTIQSDNKLLERSNTLATNTNKSANSTAAGTVTTYKKPYQPQAVNRTFVEYLPITEQEAAHLKAQTGRDFTVRYLNDLVRELQSKNSELRARYRKGMLAYLKISVTGEKREDHNIKDGKYIFKYSKAMEKRFAEVESSQRTTMDALMQKRVIALFEPYRAFSILERCTFPREVWVSKFNSSEHSYGIYSRSNIILTQSEQDILEKAATEYSIYVDELTGELKSAKVQFLKHDHNRDSSKGNSRARSATSSTVSIQSTISQSTQSSTKAELGEAASGMDGDITNTEKNTQHVENGEQSQSGDNSACQMSVMTFDKTFGIHVDSDGLTFVQKDIHPIWREVRKELLKRYNLGVDRSWFSQISFSYDEANKTAMLHYESRFRQRMAGEQYGDAMYRAIATALTKVESIKSCAMDERYVSGTYTENVWWRSTHKPMYS